MCSEGGDRVVLIEGLKLPLPPSLNHAYVNTACGRMKSDKARKYDTAVRVLLGDKLALKPLPALLNVPLHLKIEVELAQLENKGWSCGTAKSRYKKLDVSNRIKLLEDVLCKMLYIDDSQFLSVTAVKRQGVEDCCIVTISKEGT